jgi:hypothetical protein
LKVDSAAHRKRPTSDFSIASYTCTECAQGWWIEFAPEEVMDPAFALKLRGSVEPSLAGIASAKAFLCILAHGGFDPEQCRHKDCRNWKLRGREICHLHFTFP